MKKFNVIRACVLSVSLSACGGGGNDVAKVSESSESPEGIYSGFFTSDQLNRTYEVTGVVTDAGEGHFINRDSREQIVVQLNVDGDRLAGPIRVFQPANPSALATLRTDGAVSGSVASRDSISGSYNNADGDSGTFSLLYERGLFERSSRLQQLSGVWAAESADERYSITVTIREDGSLSGSDSKGCVYGGTLTIPDGRFNLYRVSEVAVTCGATAYTAGGWVVRHPAQAGAPGDLETLENIEFGFANETRAYYNRLTKVSAPAAPAR